MLWPRRLAGALLGAYAAGVGFILGLVFAGADGFTGVPKFTETGGDAGAHGPAVATGITGSTGFTWVPEATWATGFPGATGVTETPEITRTAGVTKTAGVTGATGVSGTTGATGPTGAPGRAGATGPTGVTGTPEAEARQSEAGKSAVWAQALSQAARQRPGRWESADLERAVRSWWEQFPLQMDWLFQDAPDRPPGEQVDFPRDVGWLFTLQADAEAFSKKFRQLMDRVLRELPPEEAQGFWTRLEELVQAKTSPSDARWLEVYEEACFHRRRVRLRQCVALVPRFVFTKHYTLGGSHYAYTEGLSNAHHERHFIPPAALCLAQWDGQHYQVETLLDSPTGVIRDPDVSYDGRRVLFAWKKSDRQDDYHLYEMNLADRQVRQLTDGLGLADYEGVYLPDGRILFNSTRCFQAVDCWWTEVSNLFRCDPDGSQIQRLTFDQVHTNFPTVTEDGRVFYTRWEYNDRGQIYVQLLMEMNPDGTGQREFYGGNSWFPTTILHARSIPGTQKVLAIASGHHTKQTGKLILIDPARGRQENQGVQLVAPIRPTPAVRVDRYGQEGEQFQYPYPLTERECLVTYHPIGWRWSTAWGPRFGIYWMDLDGRRELLVWDKQLPCNQPIPVRQRRGHVRPSEVDWSSQEAICYVQDVYAGPGLAGVPRGTIHRLRVVALEYRALAIGANRNQGPGGAAMISTPIAIGNGAWDVKVILGDATVEPDGSAMFRVPARRPIYFQLLDAEGRMVQSMRSWTTLQPGEKAGCVGCHEHKNSAPLAHRPLPLALRRAPEQLRPFFGPPRGFSFPDLIQPILDAKCTACHDGNKQSDLTGREVPDPAAKRRWSRSYLQLTHSRLDPPEHGWTGNPDHPVLNWISAQSAPPMLAPYSAGSARSRLFGMLLRGEGNHPVVPLAPEEREKLAAWIDLGVPFCGDYRQANLWSEAEKEKYEQYLAGRRRYGQEPAEPPAGPPPQHATAR
jgi:hypothetical protein